MRALLAGIVFLTMTLLASCEFPGSQRPSVLLLAVDGLGFEDIVCDEAESSPKDRSGIQLLCDESVRFTHAFTSSAMVQPALVTLFTGLYPLEHQVHHNGSQHLSAEVRTVSEEALRLGYRTGFWSGGPPILAKSGLQQGFEIFDDGFPVEMGVFNRSSLSVFRSMSSWIKSSVGRSSFWAGAFLTDLNVPPHPDTVDVHDVKDQSRSGRLRALDLSLFGFFEKLKRQGRWENTHVVLVGLTSSPSHSRTQIWQPLDVKGSQTHVGLLIKPARKKRDRGLNWAVDSNVSLADVGTTLYSLIKGKSPDLVEKSLVRVDLSRVLSSPKVDWNEDRVILIESAWGAWRDGLPIRYATRFRHYLYVHDRPGLLYNTLIDRSELVSLSLSDPVWWTLETPMRKFFTDQKIPEFQDVSLSQQQLRWLKSEVWQSGSENAAARAQFLKAVLKGGASVDDAHWAIRMLAAESEWGAVEEMGRVYRREDWIFLGRKAAGLAAKRPREACSMIFKRPFKLSDKEDTLLMSCEDESAILLKGWYKTLDLDQRRRQVDRLARWKYWREREDRLAMENQRNFLNWDIPRQWPRPLSTLDWMLNLPYSRSLREAMNRHHLYKDSRLNL